MSKPIIKNQISLNWKSVMLILLIVSLGYSSLLSAQTRRELSEMYQNHQIEKLDNLRKSNKIEYSGWRLFVDALFIDEAESATIKMMQAYSTTSDAALKTLVRQRISQYYSAKGYYETARKILEDEHSFREIVSIKTKHLPTETEAKHSFSTSGQSKTQDLYGIQLGAFSAYNNAESTSQQYQSHYSNTEIIQKSRNGETLYIVIIGGYRSRGDAEKALPQINETFNVSGYIIQY